MEAWERWWNMAQGSLAAAQLLAKEGKVRPSASRAYYAAFQAVTALLLYHEMTPPDGREAWSHEATPELFRRLSGIIISEDARKGITMPTAFTANNQEVDNTYRKVYDWLSTQAEALGLHATLLRDEATPRHGWLYLPVHIEGVTDAYDNALKLQNLEDTWNDRVPQPEPPLFLVPARDPLRKAVGGRLQMPCNEKARL